MNTIKHEHKQQLHERIVERCRQMNLTLVTLRLDAKRAKSVRARAIEEALAALETHLIGGWASVDEPEAAALVRWLDSSRYLFDVTPIPAAAPVAATVVQS